MKNGYAVFENDQVKYGELAQTQLFRGVNAAAVEGALQICPHLSLRADQVLIAPGQPNQLLYVVLSGRLRVYDETRHKLIGHIQTGDSVGLFSLIDRQACHVYVVAEQACRLLVIDEDRLLSLINTASAFSRNMLFALMHYLRDKNAAAAVHEKLSAKIERDNNVDAVTGLHNRRWIDAILDRQIMRSGADRKPLSVCMVDIDALGRFNEEFGRNAGDQALYCIANAIAASIRPTDLVARYEDDAFLVVLPDTEQAQAEMIADRLRRAIAETSIEIPNECVLPPLTAETGVAQMRAFVAPSKLIADAKETLANRRLRTSAAA